jgi:hypothetical protein
VMPQKSFIYVCILLKCRDVFSALDCLMRTCSPC